MKDMYGCLKANFRTRFLLATFTYPGSDSKQPKTSAERERHAPTEERAKCDAPVGAKFAEHTVLRVGVIE